MRICLVLVVIASLMAGGQARAVNWEGHDGWFYDPNMFREFYDGIKPPRPAPLPSCEDRRRRHDTNRYEQTPIAGVNCVEERAKDQNQ